MRQPVLMSLMIVVRGETLLRLSPRFLAIPSEHGNRNWLGFQKSANALQGDVCDQPGAPGSSGLVFVNRPARKVVMQSCPDSHVDITIERIAGSEFEIPGQHRS